MQASLGSVVRSKPVMDTQRESISKIKRMGEGVPLYAPSVHVLFHVIQHGHLRQQFSTFRGCISDVLHTRYLHYNS